MSKEESHHQHDEALLLQELKAISDRRSAQRYVESSTCDDNNDSNKSAFLRATPEDQRLNQFWYSQSTIDTLHHAILEGITLLGNPDARVAFLSTPSLYFAFEATARENFYLFDFDDKTWASDAHYVFYDYKEHLCFDEDYKHSFDMVVIDPPFITREVWEKYAESASALLKQSKASSSSSTSLVLCTTVEENASIMKELFDAAPTKFQPSIPNLVYQYATFANFHSDRLSEPNEELNE